ncbi:MAG: YkgJ family cysteine cluster protein [Candidatus Hodarchaeota archaeon]
MDRSNPCHGCIGKKGNDCCSDVFIILNDTETHLFENYNGFKYIGELGGLFYTTKGCPYLDETQNCGIHDKKPLYCKFYPIFITGEIFVDDDCPMHTLKRYELSERRKKKIFALQKRFPIYKKDWFFSDVLKEYQKSDLTA